MKHYLMPLDQFLALDDVWGNRFEQIQMEVEHNLDQYPYYRKHYEEYHSFLDSLENSSPAIEEAVSKLIALSHTYFSDLALEAYKQGATDLFQYIHDLQCRSHLAISDQED